MIGRNPGAINSSQLSSIHPQKEVEGGAHYNSFRFDSFTMADKHSDDNENIIGNIAASPTAFELSPNKDPRIRRQ
jgi:hypothetical protein